MRGSRKVDVVHAHWWLPSGVIAVIAGRITNTPVVVQVHGTDAAMAQGPLRWFARWVLRRADAVIAVSEDLAGWV
ncbi:MAG TPA: glycosyltransferase family 4 protein, partial [Acidimicrobiaceae bacterium]|nr:glycosyltransferase family 4 protein [Acidimicrobiaceae bacterium]